jgi:hypothetical protein
VWFSLVFLLVATWGLIVFGVALFNPKDLMAKFYRFDQSRSRIGPLKLGIFFYSDNPGVHRVTMAGLGALLAVGCIAIFISLV